MARLQMRTKTDPQPREFGSERRRTLSRVYFSAHPADHAKYLDALANEIYRTHDCVFCFDARPDLPYDEATLADLEHMNLVVIPITTRLLTDPVQRRVLEVDLSFAAAHHIPVLPLMQEEGLDYLYGKTEAVKNLQFLSQYDTSAAALPYVDKLKMTLDAALLDPREAMEVRKAFPARIFLSYRKKDRTLAQDLRRAIHKGEALRDVAIWYDEFLSPGEDFNQTIQQALGEADLFTLAVTDHLLEAGNYVIRHEYPAALEQDKPVLPVQVARTDGEKFAAAFLTVHEDMRYHIQKEDMQKKIKELVQPMTDASPALQETVRHSLEAALKKPLQENNEPRHLYRMGMAYLHGIDTEIDRERARELFLAAAEQEDISSMLRLSELYEADAATLGQDAAAAETCRNLSADWAENAVFAFEKLYANGDRRTDLVKAMFWAKNALAAKLICTKHTGNVACAWGHLWDILQWEGAEYTAGQDSAFFAQVYYHAAVAALYLSEPDAAVCLPKPRKEAVKEYMDEAIRLEQAAVQSEGDPAEQTKRLLNRYVAAGEFFARLKDNAAAVEYFSKARQLYGDFSSLQDREVLGKLAHLFFREAALQGRITGSHALQQAEKLMQKIPNKEKTAGDWHLQSKLRMHQALGQYLMIDNGFVKNEGKRNALKAEVQRLVQSACDAAKTCMELDGATLASKESYCQILRESIILYRHLKNTDMMQQCGAELRKMAVELQDCTGRTELLLRLSDSFVALARSQQAQMVRLRDVPQAEALFVQALQDCQQAEALLHSYQERGGCVPVMSLAGLEYTRGLLYRAAGQCEEALSWFQAACVRLEQDQSRSAEENSLLQWCQKEVKAISEGPKR